MGLSRFIAVGLASCVAALAASAAPPPLSVRVLERERLGRAQLEASVFECEDAAGTQRTVEGPRSTSTKNAGAAADAPLRRLGVSVGQGMVRVDDGPGCTVLLARGLVTVRTGALGGLVRRYTGTLRVSGERGALRLVLETDVEDYLPSVVAAELDASKPAAIEAQAVVSRTFALASRGRHDDVDLCDLTHCQAFPGATEVSPEALAAVRRTRGQVLLTGGITLEPVFFHAACGGHTSAPAEVFGVRSTASGVSDVVDGRPLCREAPELEWRSVVERRALAQALGVRPEGTAFEALRRDAGGRVLELRAFGRRFTGTELASRVGRSLGWRTLRSVAVTAEEIEGEVRFSGRGLGHGVGLCQHGARALAERGADAARILKLYFPHATVGAADALPPPR